MSSCSNNRTLELAEMLEGNALLNLRRAHPLRITASSILHNREVMGNPDHPEYPQWAKERDARLRAQREAWLRPLIERTFALAAHYQVPDPSQPGGYWLFTGRIFYLASPESAHGNRGAKSIYRWVWLYAPRT